MFELDAFEVIYLLLLIAVPVILAWLAITAIRALNVCIAKNKAPSDQRQFHSKHLITRSPDQFFSNDG